MPGRPLGDIPDPNYPRRILDYHNSLEHITIIISRYVRDMQELQADLVRDEARNVLPVNLSNVLDSILQINNQMRLFRRMVGICLEQLSDYLTAEGIIRESSDEFENEENEEPHFRLNGFH